MRIRSIRGGGGAVTYGHETIAQSCMNHIIKCIKIMEHTHMGDNWWIGDRYIQLTVQLLLIIPEIRLGADKEDLSVFGTFSQLWDPLVLNHLQYSRNFRMMDN